MAVKTCPDRRFQPVGARFCGFLCPGFILCVIPGLIAGLTLQFASF